MVSRPYVVSGSLLGTRLYACPLTTTQSSSVKLTEVPLCPGTVIVMVCHSPGFCTQLSMAPMAPAPPSIPEKVTGGMVIAPGAYLRAMSSLVGTSTSATVKPTPDICATCTTPRPPSWMVTPSAFGDTVPKLGIGTVAGPPGAPGRPCGPAGPAGPAGPVAPVAPAAPVFPAGPWIP